MRNLLSIFFVLFPILLYSQGSQSKSATIDLKQNDEKFINYIVIENKGVLLLTEIKHHGFHYELVLRFLNFDGSQLWQKSLTDKELVHGVWPGSLNLQVMYNSDYIYLSTFTAGGDDLEYINQISYGGNIKLKEINENKIPVYDKGINGKNFFLVVNRNKTYKDATLHKFTAQIDPVTLTLGEEIPLSLPVLEKGQWEYIAAADNEYYFSGTEKKYKPDHSVSCFINELSSTGSLKRTIEIDAATPDDLYPVPNKVNSAKGTDPPTKLFADTKGKAFFLYGYCQENPIDFGAYINTLRHKGFYICKYDWNGKLVWKKQYSFTDLKKLGCSFEEVTPKNDWKMMYFNVEEDGGIMVVLKSEFQPSYNNFITDAEGNIKNFTRGADQYEKKFYSDNFYTNNGSFNFLRTCSFTGIKSGDKTGLPYLAHLQKLISRQGVTESKIMYDVYHLEKSTLVIQINLTDSKIAFNNFTGE